MMTQLDRNLYKTTPEMRIDTSTLTAMRSPGSLITAMRLPGSLITAGQGSGEAAPS